MRSAVLIAALGGAIGLGLVNAAIVQKETLLNEGAVVFLELAPVDPRSLMQGDYMALRFGIGDEIRGGLSRGMSERGLSGSRFESRDGMVIVTVDDRGVGCYARLDDDKPLAENEHRMEFRVRNGRVKFATNAFFFQEGSDQVYAKAEYGEFRVALDGELLLTGMRDAELNRLSASDPAP